MKGIVFNLFEEAVGRVYGDAFWDEILTSAGLDGAYTSLGSYSDDDLLKLVAAVASRLDTPAEAVVHWFGRNALTILAERYPLFFEPHDETVPFLLTLNNIIHPEVRKIYPGADVPDFDFSRVGEKSLVMGYRSRRKLCAFAHGLIEGAAEHYGERVTVAHPECQNRGDLKCRFELSFARIAE